MKILGVVGGGTKTVGAIGTKDGKIISSCVVGPSNPQSVGFQEAGDRLREIVLKLVPESMFPETYSFFGLAGVGRPDDQAKISKVLIELGLPEAQTAVGPDAVADTLGGVMGPSGICVVGGTGSIVYLVSEDGSMFRTGGYGQFLGDKGSAYGIALEALIAVMKLHNRGNDGETVLTGQFLEVTKCENTMELVGWIQTLFREKHLEMKEKVAALAPIVLQAAEKGDETAVYVVSLQAYELANDLLAVLENPASEGINKIVFTGGVLEGSDYYRDRVVSQVRFLLDFRRFKPLMFIKPKGPAVLGALIMAATKAGIKVNDKFTSELLESWDKVKPAA